MFKMQMSFKKSNHAISYSMVNSAFHLSGGWLNEHQECLGNSLVVKSELSPQSGSAVMRQLNPFHEKNR